MPDVVDGNDGRTVGMRRLSVVIANHNYARFLTRSVDSALAQRWDDLEVVVVDDGSTDGSLEILRGYGDRIRLIESENRGQREAVNLGFAASTGDAVVFLDSDDVLPPGLAVAASAVIDAATTKVQFRMQRIDESDREIGRPFPDYSPVPGPDLIRRWATATTAYPTPPGSGNLYTRWFLDRLMPLGPEIGAFADSGLLAAAPLLGDVRTARSVVVGYRRHGANDSALRRDPQNFRRECDRAMARWEYACRVARRAASPSRVFRSREVLQFRVGAARVSPDRMMPGDGVARIVADALRSPFLPGPEQMAKRFAIAGWAVLTVLAPRPLAERLLSARFGPPA